MTLDAARVRQHLSPAWREKANFIIRAPMPDEGWYEQLWARQIDAHTFQVCCIPFFLYDLALGDTVRTSDSYELEEVIEQSGRGVFRVFFPPTSLQERQGLVAKLSTEGALLEWSSENLLAVDAAAEHIAPVVDLLEEGAQRGRFEYENGRTSY